MSVLADDKFTKLACKMLFLTPDQVENLRGRQKEVSRAGAKLSLFEIAHSDAVLTQEQLDKVQLAAEYTEMLDEERRIGALAIAKGLASDEEIAICIDTQKYEFASQRAIPRRLTEIMVEAEILTPETSAELTKAYESGGAAKPAPVAPGGEARGAGGTAKRAAEPTIPYDTKRLEEVEAMAEQLDVPPDLSPEEDTRHEAPPDAHGQKDTPVEGSDPGIAPAAGAPGRVPGTGGATRRLTARLVMETGEMKGRAVPLTGKGRIGRQMGCMVRIDDNRASREHAQIDYDAQLRLHVVSDLQSRNGTFVNDTKIVEPTVLNPGDLIRIGDTIMRYEA